MLPIILEIWLWWYDIAYSCVDLVVGDGDEKFMRVCNDTHPTHMTSFFIVNAL